MASAYARFLVVLKKWPVSAIKEFEDYGSHLRGLIKQRNLSEVVFSKDYKEETAKIDSLIRLSENKYSNKYSTSYKVGSTGFSTDELKTFLPKILSKLQDKK